MDIVRDREKADQRVLRYIGELSPSQFRGRLVTISILFITIGQMVAYLVGYLLSTHAHGWRWMVGLGALPAAVQVVLLLALLPESPRWLVRAGREDEARAVLESVYNHDTRAIVKEVMAGIKREIRAEETATERRGVAMASQKRARLGTQWLMELWGELLCVKSNRRALAVACLIQGLQQLCGFVCLLSLCTYRVTDIYLLELLDVLLRHNLRSRGLHRTDAPITLNRSHKLRLHNLCPPPH